MLLLRVGRPGRNLVRRSHKRDIETFTAELLGDDTSDVVVVIVIDHDRARGCFPSHDVVRRHDAGTIPAGYRIVVGSSNTVSSPLRSSCDHDMVWCKFEDLLLVDHTLEPEFNIRELRDLVQSPFRDTSPLIEPG